MECFHSYVVRALIPKIRFGTLLRTPRPNSAAPLPGTVATKYRDGVNRKGSPMVRHGSPNISPPFQGIVSGKHNLLAALPSSTKCYAVDFDEAMAQSSLRSRPQESSNSDCHPMPSLSHQLFKQLVEPS